jgi:hypothetical protein
MFSIQNWLIDFILHLVGFEKGLFKRTNEKRATETEAYLWSVSDMWLEGNGRIPTCRDVVPFQVIFVARTVD